MLPGSQVWHLTQENHLQKKVNLGTWSQQGGDLTEPQPPLTEFWMKLEDQYFLLRYWSQVNLRGRVFWLVGTEIQD